MLFPEKLSSRVRKGAAKARGCVAKFGAPVVRGFLLALGIVVFAYGLPASWSSLAESMGGALTWLSANLWGVAGGFLLLIAIGWRSGWDFLSWVVGLFVPPWRLIGTTVLLVGVALIVLNTIHDQNVSLALIFVSLWIGAGLVLVPSSAATDTPVDRLHRAHMVGRLADYLVTLPPNARRIGILGPWGEGKSYVLRLLRSELHRRNADKTFRMAWVNPWRATSSREAWEEIAKGFDRALGFPRLLPRPLLSVPGLGAVLELLPWPLSGLTGDLKDLLSSGEDDARRIATGIEGFLRRRKQWLLIFVDDMERVSEEQLRKLFPVVDRLGEIERCYFVFAIDPSRVAKAFEEDATNTDETKGYLDKVLDFQFTLPPASHADVFEALNKLSSSESCPRLVSALPKLREYLPKNPRQATRFQREAEAREIMFLSRFGVDEQNYEGFFILLLIELQFPKAHAKLKTALNENIGTLGLEAIFGIESGSEDANKALEKVRESVCGSMEDDSKAELVPLLERLFALCIEPACFLKGERPLDRDWAFEGYRKLLRFTAEERKQFLHAWEKYAGRRSLEEMLTGVSGGEPFSETEVAIAQALTIEIESIRDRLGDAYRMVHDDHDLTPLQEEVITRMGRIRDHARATNAGSFSELDKQVFSNWLMAPWMEALERNSLHGLPDGFRKAVQVARAEVTETLADALPSRERYSWCQSGSMRPIEWAPNPEIANAYKEELVPVRDAVLARFTDQAVSLFRQKPIADVFPLDFLIDKSADTLHDPQAWLLPTVDRAQEVLSQLVEEAATNSTIHGNFVTIVRHVILSPFAISRGENHPAQAERRKSIKKHPWYLELCWKGAWASEPSGDDRRAMIRLRNKAIKIEQEVDAAGEGSVLAALQGLKVPEESKAGEEEKT